mmetsp:Transcript_11028/g.12403  ORF Transcript_11028/g.12403 Transcript_11028/m.12403 type:complete len:119 (-) Transcript_11028:187-543(-)
MQIKSPDNNSNTDLFESGSVLKTSKTTDATASTLSHKLTKWVGAYSTFKKTHEIIIVDGTVNTRMIMTEVSVVSEYAFTKQKFAWQSRHPSTAMSAISLGTKYCFLARYLASQKPSRK